MKLVIIAALVLTGCSVTHKSDQYACTKNTDCESGRECSIDGFCVLVGTAIDAPKPTDAPRGDGGGNAGCPSQCTSCNTAQKTCTINCAQGGNCPNQVVCPAGYKCDIQCNTDGSCRNGINCTQGASCNIDCVSKQSCENVQCGMGPCSVSCGGQASCKNVSCGNSCACDVLCTGIQTCASGIQCSSFACRSGLGCTSVPALCHSCQ
jgi:hypothetical protein